MSTGAGRPISCFLCGYGGANNTGSDVRILTMERSAIIVISQHSRRKGNEHGAAQTRPKIQVTQRSSATA